MSSDGAGLPGAADVLGATLGCYEDAGLISQQPTDRRGYGSSSRSMRDCRGPYGCGSPSPSTIGLTLQTVMAKA